MEIEPIIENTNDGSQTLRHPILGELYHSVNGARSESQHIYIKAGFNQYCDSVTIKPAVVRVLEIGFGSGLNAILTLQRGQEMGCEVEYTALEKYPISLNTALELEYASLPFFEQLHRAQWGERVEISPLFWLEKLERDLVNTNFETIFNIDLVYFDPFAPDNQPELWSLEIFSKIYGVMSKGGLLVTYSAKGDVKRALRGAGFEIRRVPGALGKRHMLRAVKTR